MNLININSVLGPSIFLFAALFMLIGCGPSEAEMERAQQSLTEEARKWANMVQEEMQPPIASVRTMKQNIEVMLKEGKASRSLINTFLKEKIEQHSDYLAVWTCWEPNALDNLDSQYQNTQNHDHTGRFIPYWNRINGNIHVQPLTDYTKPGPGDYYLIPLNSGKETVLNPSPYVQMNEVRFKTNVTAPIRFNGRVVGVVGIDIPLRDSLDPIVRQIKFYDIGYGFLIANNGVLTAHPIKWSLVGKSMDQFLFNPESILAVKEGREAIEHKTSKATGKVIVYTFVPIPLGDSDLPWSLATNIPLEVLKKKAGS